MSRFEARRDGPGGFGRRRVGAGVILGVAIAAGVAAMIAYGACKVEVGTGQQAVLVRLAGLDLERDMELAPGRAKDGSYYKGVQADGPHDGVLTEGRYFYNPLYWSWEIGPQVEIPSGKLGVRIALAGADLPAGQALADEGQKGIRRGVLLPGRYPINPYATKIEQHEPVTVPAGFRGVVTLMSGTRARVPNSFLVAVGERGVQEKTLEPGTHYLNPYEARVSLVDCRSKRFNLNQDDGMDFLSSDGFPVTLDGAVEFRVIPERAAEVFVKYNDDANGDSIDAEIIAKIITPESRSLCRTGGSKLSGGQFISGNDREAFQRTLVASLTENCRKQGIEILAVAITTILPPQEIAGPVRAREVAKQELSQYKQEKLQQISEAQLQIQVLLAEQKQKVVEAEQGVIEKTTRAEQDNLVAITLAEQKLKVAQTRLEAAKDQASAIVAKAQADAEVIRFNNRAEVAGLAERVAAFDGDGAALARSVLVRKVAPAFRSIMTNTDGPLMGLFDQFSAPSPRPPSPAPGPVAAPAPTPTPAPAPAPSIAEEDPS
ncbi:SPFH domain-containing protein [Tundrisphaera sp. TA3]|uniref:SPFH domain-containing protein n=1 Tax=Tundrisphaera sp. TA3 TaxID=3435775 RepID=UPI003EBC96CA